jgi:hypothetical protein
MRRACGCGHVSGRGRGGLLQLTRWQQTVCLRGPLRALRLGLALAAGAEFGGTEFGVDVVLRLADALTAASVTSGARGLVPAEEAPRGAGPVRLPRRRESLCGQS